MPCPGTNPAGDNVGRGSGQVGKQTEPKRRPTTGQITGYPDLVLIVAIGTWHSALLSDQHTKNPYYLFGTQEESDYTHCGIKTRTMRTYSDIALKEEFTALRSRNFNNADGLQKLVASIPDD